MVSPEALCVLSEEFIRAHRVLPLRKKENSLSTAMIDPFDLKLIAQVEKLTSCEIRPLIAMEQEFEEVVNKLFK
jgi:type II secretory ATPase GspE/PulE/Tfp pilus assembly ATPase PilB-like protein